ncbi:MAG: PspC domain-containing protein [Bacteroidales bacterium]
MDKRLFKSKNKKISGVLGGIGEYLNIDPTVVRVGYVLLTFFTGLVPGIVAYLIMAIVIPNE